MAQTNCADPVGNHRLISALADPAGLGGRPYPKEFFQNPAVFRQIKGKKPYFEQILGSGPPSGVKTLLGPPDQNPGSSPAEGYVFKSLRPKKRRGERLFGQYVETPAKTLRTTILHVCFARKNICDWFGINCLTRDNFPPDLIPYVELA